MECLINSYSIMSELLSPQEEDCANEEWPFTFQMNTERKREVKQLQQGCYYLLLMMQPCPGCIHPLCSAIRTAVFSIICLYFNSNPDLHNSQQIAFAFFVIINVTLFLLHFFMYNVWRWDSMHNLLCEVF